MSSMSVEASCRRPAAWAPDGLAVAPARRCDGPRTRIDFAALESFRRNGGSSQFAIHASQFAPTCRPCGHRGKGRTLCHETPAASTAIGLSVSRRSSLRWHPQSAAAQRLAPIVYTISAPAPATHIAVIEAVVPTEGKAAIDLMMPVWSPGFYRVEDYAGRVQEFSARTADGHRHWRSINRRRTAGTSRRAGHRRSSSPTGCCAAGAR